MTTPTPSPSASQMSSAWPSVFTQPRSAQYIGCIGSMASGMPAGRAYLASSAMESKTCFLAPARSLDWSASPPTTSTRQRAPSSTASSTARRLSSMARSWPATSEAAKKPPRHNPVTSRPALRIRRAFSAKPPACISMTPRVDRGDAELLASLDRFTDGALPPDGRGVERQQVGIAGEIAHGLHTMPCTASTARTRRAASSGSRNSPARSASRTSSARCTSERALCWPPTITKWSWWPFR